MAAVLLGILLGAGVSYGWFAQADAPLSLAADNLTSQAAAFLQPLLGRIPGLDATGEFVIILAALLAVCTPGVVAMAAAAAGSATQRAQFILSFLLAAVSVVLLLSDPGGWWPLVVGLLVVAATLLRAAAFAAVVALWVVITVLAVDQLTAIWQGTVPEISSATDVLVDVSGLNTPGVFAIALSVVAAAPFVAALRTGLDSK
jgi:hypothetical protein